MITLVRERTDTEILLHLCRAMALKGILTDDNPDDGNDKDRHQ